MNEEHVIGIDIEKEAHEEKHETDRVVETEIVVENLKAVTKIARAVTRRRHIRRTKKKMNEIVIEEYFMLWYHKS